MTTRPPKGTCGAALSAIARGAASRIAHDPPAAASANRANEGVPTRGAIAAGLMRGVLPGLQALIINDVKGGVVRAPIVMAIVRVVQALPEEADKLTHVRAAAIQTTSNALASHGPDVRDSAREALIGVARVVGAREMPQIIAALCTSLRKGYQLHVLGYTLHAILERVAADPSTAPGDLDSSVDPLVPILAEDVMGLAAEERKVGKIAAKGKEARKCCSYDSLAILARSVHFSADAAVVSSLVDAVASYVPSSTSPRVRERVAEMLRALARGFLANRTASPQELLLLVHSLLDAHAPAASAGGEGRVAPREQQRDEQLPERFPLRSVPYLKYERTNHSEQTCSASQSI